MHIYFWLVASYLAISYLPKNWHCPRDLKKGEFLFDYAPWDFKQGEFNFACAPWILRGKYFNFHSAPDIWIKLSIYSLWWGDTH